MAAPLPPPDQVEITYTIRHDLAADGLCGLAGLCDCTVTWSGGGDLDHARSTASRWTFSGTWRRTGGDCHDALTLWTPADGRAFHTLTLDPSGVWTGWIAHARPELSTPLSAGIREAGQVYVVDFRAPIADGRAEHREFSEGQAGALAIRTEHVLHLRARRPAPAPLPPTGPVTLGWSYRVSPAPEAGDCTITGLCDCEVQGILAGSELRLGNHPAGMRGFSGDWSVTSSTCAASEDPVLLAGFRPVVLWFTSAGGRWRTAVASVSPPGGIHDDLPDTPEFALVVDAEAPQTVGSLSATTAERRDRIGADGVSRSIAVTVERRIELPGGR